MKVAQVIEGIFEAMPMVERRRFLTERMLREYGNKIMWNGSMTNQTFCDVDIHLVYREYDCDLHHDDEYCKRSTVKIAELTLVED